MKIFGQCEEQVATFSSPEEIPESNNNFQKKNSTKRQFLRQPTTPTTTSQQLTPSPFPFSDHHPFTTPTLHQLWPHQHPSTGPCRQFIGHFKPPNNHITIHTPPPLPPLNLPQQCRLVQSFDVIYVILHPISDQKCPI